MNIFELEEIAKESLTAIAYDYYRGGAWDEITLHANRAAFDKWKIHYHILKDVSQRDLSVSILDTKINHPILIAPTAFHKLAHPDGELATGRAAAATNTIMTLSSLSTTTIEEVAEVTNKNFWFQLYINKDRPFTAELVARAHSAGAKALVVTVDTPIWGKRERDARNGFHLPPGMSAINLVKSNKDGEAKGQSGAGMDQAFDWILDASLQWKDLDWLTSISSMPIFLKGVCRADDALIAMDHGVKGIIVSNHGGRQLDGAPATIDVLPLIADAVGDQIILLMDGGIRRGTDILKALSLGARAVMLGRPILWGLAAGGQSGVEKVISILIEELDLAMALSGCKTIADLNSELLEPTAGK